MSEESVGTRLPTPQLMIKPIGWFVSDPVDESTDEFSNLVASVCRYGVLEPPICSDDGEVIAGRHRLAAARKAAIKELAASVYSGLTATQKRLVTVSENIQRKDMPDNRVFLLVRELEELNPGWQNQDLAAHLGKSASWVTRAKSPSRLIPEAFDAFMADKFGFSKAYAISNSPDQVATLSLVLGGGTRDAIERKSRKAKAAPAAKAAKIRCPLPSGQVVTISGDEISLEDAMDAAQEAAKQIKVALSKGVTAKTAQSYWKDVAAAR